MTITLYGIPNCDTVKKARAWLDGQGVAYQFHDFKKAGVPQAGLQRWLAAAGWQTLLKKEVLRFWKVSFQTVAAPVLTAVLYLLIFGHVLEDHVQVYPGVRYTSFLIPGLVMMSDELLLAKAFCSTLIITRPGTMKSM